MNHLIHTGLPKEIQLTHVINRVVSFVSSEMEVPEEAVKANIRFRKIQDTRQLCCYILVNKYKRTTTEVGKFFRPKRKRPHDIAIHACRVVGERMEVDKAFRKIVVDLFEKA